MFASKKKLDLTNKNKAPKFLLVFNLIFRSKKENEHGNSPHW